MGQVLMDAAAHPTSGIKGSERVGRRREPFEHEAFFSHEVLIISYVDGWTLVGYSVTRGCDVGPYLVVVAPSLRWHQCRVPLYCNSWMVLVAAFPPPPPCSASDP